MEKKIKEAVCLHVIRHLALVREDVDGQEGTPQINLSKIMTASYIAGAMDICEYLSVNDGGIHPSKLLEVLYKIAENEG